MEPLNCVGTLRITNWACAEIYGHSGAAERQISFVAKIDLLRQNRHRNTVHRKFGLLIWRQMEPLNRVGDLRVTR
jgi:hypothetical protein